MNNIVSREHKQAAEYMREKLSKYYQAEDLINIGAYKRGTSREIDDAIQAFPTIIQFLKQDVESKWCFTQTKTELIDLMK
jgi:flagellum-specific ATP synthase